MSKTIIYDQKDFEERLANDLVDMLLNKLRKKATQQIEVGNVLGIVIGELKRATHLAKALQGVSIQR